MNIGIVTTWFDRGAAYVSKAYMDTFRSENNVFIFARGGEYYGINDPNWDHENVTWAEKNKLKPDLYINWKEFSNWIKKNRIDIILFNEQRDWDIIIRCQELNIPIGAYIDYYTKETIPYFWLYDFLFCNTQKHFQVFKNHPQVFYLPWGTNINQFKPPTNSTKNIKITFFHSCGISPIRKGTDILVNAFNQFKGDANLIIHSQEPLIDKYPDIYHLIKQDKRIKLIEKLVPQPGLFYMGDVYVYPTILEGIGLTIMEALASGLPVITTNEAPMNEFIIDGQNGKLVDVAYRKRRYDNYYWDLSYCDLTSLVNAFNYYYENIYRIDSFKQNARDYAIHHLDWKKNSESLNQIIKEIAITRTQENCKLLNNVKSFETKRFINHYHDYLTSRFTFGFNKLVRFIKPNKTKE